MIRHCRIYFLSDFVNLIHSQPLSKTLPSTSQVKTLVTIFHAGSATYGQEVGGDFRKSDLYLHRNTIHLIKAQRHFYLQMIDSTHTLREEMAHTICEVFKISNQNVLNCFWITHHYSRPNENVYSNVWFIRIFVDSCYKFPNIRFLCKCWLQVAKQKMRIGI